MWCLARVSQALAALIVATSVGLATADGAPRARAGVHSPLLDSPRRFWC